VFFPYRLTQKIFNDIGEEYALRFSEFHISRKKLEGIQKNIIMVCRPSMRIDIEKCGIHNGIFLYSLWEGYRNDKYQQTFERSLESAGFTLESLHTSGHATVSDIRRVIKDLDPKKLIPIHTMHPDTFYDFSDRTERKKDGVKFEV
jgi:ribonuclease J